MEPKQLTTTTSSQGLKGRQFRSSVGLCGDRPKLPSVFSPGKTCPSFDAFQQLQPGSPTSSTIILFLLVSPSGILLTYAKFFHSSPQIKVCTTVSAAQTSWQIKGALKDRQDSPPKQPDFLLNSQAYDNISRTVWQ